MYIEGRLRTRTYEKEGQTHYSTEIIADNMQMLGSRAGAGNPDRGPVESQVESAPAPTTSAAKNDNFNDDDIPF